MAVGFEEIYIQNRRYVFRVCRQVLHNDADAEDITQETFIKAWQALPRFRGEQYGSWLYRIARNLAISKVRRDRAPVNVGARPQDVSADDPLFDHEGNTYRAQIAQPDAGLELMLLQLDLHRGLNRMRPQARRMLELRLQGLTYREMAGVLGATLAATQSGLLYVRQELRRQIQYARPQ